MYIITYLILQGIYHADLCFMPQQRGYVFGQGGGWGIVVRGQGNERQANLSQLPEYMQLHAIL